MKYHCLILCLMLLSNTAVGADPVINRYLLAAEQSFSIETQAIAGETSWIDEAEIRYSGNDADEQSLAFRFRPRITGERKAADRILQLLNLQFTTARKERLNDELKVRYNRLLDLIVEASELDYLEQKTKLSQDNLALNRSLVQTENFNIANLQDAELAHQSNQQQLQLSRDRIRSLMTSFGAVSPQQLEIFLSQWAQQVSDWEDFQVFSVDLLRLVENDRLPIGSEQIEFQLAQQKLKLARGEASGWLKFVELKYVERDTGDEETSLGLSFPLGRSRLDVSERAADLNLAKLSLKLAQAEVSQRVYRFVSDLEWQRNQARLLADSKQLLEQQYKRMLDANQPAILIGMKNDILGYEIQLRRNHVRAMRDYIGLLHSARYLAKEPLTNWLIRGQPLL